jgi:predicted DNA-binding transcriptional regulator YafY
VKIIFEYFSYNVKKEKVLPKRIRRRIASPYKLVWADNNYYLLAYERNKIRPFRIDRMSKVLSAYEELDGEEVFQALDLEDYSTRIFSMCDGKRETVTLRFSNHLVSVALDRFGNNIILRPDGKEHFTVRVEVAISNQFFGWLCGLKRGVIIISPDAVVEEMKKYLSSITKFHKAYYKKINNKSSDNESQ